MTPHFIRNKLFYQSKMLFLLFCVYLPENFDLKPWEKKFPHYNMNSKQSPINQSDLGGVEKRHRGDEL